MEAVWAEREVSWRRRLRPRDADRAIDNFLSLIRNVSCAWAEESVFWGNCKDELVFFGIWKGELRVLVRQFIVGK